MWEAGELLEAGLKFTWIKIESCDFFTTVIFREVVRALFLKGPKHEIFCIWFYLKQTFEWAAFTRGPQLFVYGQMLRSPAIDSIGSANERCTVVGTA